MTRLEPATRKHVVLIGLPGSGKSTVGPLLALLLKMPFIDVDQEIELATGTSVAVIFRDLGEARFRALETNTVGELLDRPHPSIVAPGGGWAAQPGNLAASRERGVCIYLETSPHVAAARASQAGGRPLLPQGGELPAMQQLLRNREHYYAHADQRVGTDNLSPAEVAGKVAELARMYGPL